jgi:hypothetical protein
MPRISEQKSIGSRRRRANERPRLYFHNPAAATACASADAGAFANAIAYAFASANANATAFAYAIATADADVFLTREATMQTIALTLYFDRGYIADPYWPALARLIDIQKHSGLNRARSAANRRKALEEYLNAHNMTLADYEALEKSAHEPFYRAPNGEIIIPENQVLAFLVATCDEARSATRPCAPDQVRSRFLASPWTTGKTKADGVWERFATVAAGTGQKLSNQRGLRRSEYIEKFEARGTLCFDPDFVDPQSLQRALQFGGQFVGIGASRKMGWGRFECRDFSLLKQAA